jgi:hypothetical protein
MINLLDEVIEIPFELFWGKFVERGGLDLYKHQSGAIWFSMTIEQRERAFSQVCQADRLYELIPTHYLKSFL